MPPAPIPSMQRPAIAIVIVKVVAMTKEPTKKSSRESNMILLLPKISARFPNRGMKTTPARAKEKANQPASSSRSNAIVGKTIAIDVKSSAQMKQAKHIEKNTIQNLKSLINKAFGASLATTDTASSSIRPSFLSSSSEEIGDGTLVIPLIRKFTRKCEVLSSRSAISCPYDIIEPKVSARYATAGWQGGRKTKKKEKYFRWFFSSFTTERDYL